MSEDDLAFCIGEAKEFRAIAKALDAQIELYRTSSDAKPIAQRLMNDLKEKLAHFDHVEDTESIYARKSEAFKSFCRMINRAGSQITSKPDSNPHDDRWDSQIYAFLIDIDHYLSYADKNT